MQRIRRPGRSIPAIASLMVLAVIPAACDRIDESVRDALGRTTPHEQYAASLEGAGLTRTALGRGWISAGETVLRSPLPAASPFREMTYLSPAEAAAVAYRVSARRGQKVLIEVERQGATGEPGAVFLDLYRETDDTARAPVHVTSAEGELRIAVDSRRDQSYIVRIQPELLTGGSFLVTIRVGASLAFPVQGRDSRAIQSYFGAARDGGRREHHGVDIFAPRGTPVLAGISAVVRRVGTTSLGGKVVWLWDPAGEQSLYYAHLDSQTVRTGMRVSPGDTVGFVGNTGNAISTQPHLHFGVYRRGEGPVDPHPFVHEPRSALPAIPSDPERLGQWTRTAVASTMLRVAPDARSQPVATLPRHTVGRVEGARGSWLRLRLPDGRIGWVASSQAEGIGAALRTEQAGAGAIVIDRPGAEGTLVTKPGADARLPVLGHFAGYLLVREPGGREGWLTRDAGHAAAL